MRTNICGALRDLVPFVQFKKREKHPRRSVNFSKVAGSSLQLLAHDLELISAISISEIAPTVTLFKRSINTKSPVVASLLRAQSNQNISMDDIKSRNHHEKVQKPFFLEYGALDKNLLTI